MAEAITPLTWETSASVTHQTTSDSLPDEVTACLQNARFLHLATCTDNQPHVSLMNYTYLPPHSRPTPARSNNRTQQLPDGPTIIMTSNPSSKKTQNLLSNPNVSLLVHDWVSSRPPNVTATAEGRERSPVGARSTSLANMLMQLNSAAVSSISATINGQAFVLEVGSEEEKWCKEQHLANNTFENADGGGLARVRSHGQGAHLFGTSPSDGRAGDGGRGSYIEDELVRVVVVRIRDGRISDWKGGVKDWVIDESVEGREDGMVDGVV